ncbi:class I SAM-dependent DNA methyltransferase [Pseudaestuariivita rosea]|uniref:class I SAM-dependent DNA methyltransferase n=1 Tax=Pseudaestuariivita rosea TaxID=2763263 RepID=UPI001ABBB58B|nr:methyltransferase domain-containing protein [Pseudaestuariivita rosea]
MSDKYLDKAYDARTSDETKVLYDKWSTSYDAEVAENGYATPVRAADALAKLLTDKSAPVLDFGCGTGLFGEELNSRGFRTVDGVDLSPDMLAEAKDKGVYRDVWQIEAGANLKTNPGDYAAIAAVGVIGVGAAPPETLDIMFAALATKGLMAFSLNDHAMANAQFKGKVDDYLNNNLAIGRFYEYGDHLLGISLKSAIYIFEKR